MIVTRKKITMPLSYIYETSKEKKKTAKFFAIPSSFRDLTLLRCSKNRFTFFSKLCSCLETESDGTEYRYDTYLNLHYCIEEVLLLRRGVEAH